MLAVKARIRQQVEEEFDRIVAEFGPMPQNTAPSTWLNVIGEEAGEANRALIEGDVEGYIKELAQVAACAMAAIEDLYLGDGSKTIEQINQWQAKVSEWRSSQAPGRRSSIEIVTPPGQEQAVAELIADQFNQAADQYFSPPC